MQDKQTILNNILNEIIKLESPKIDATRSKQLEKFLAITVNGDTPLTYLTIDANLNNNKQGSLTYILTNNRVIDISVDATEVEAKSFYLDAIISIERKLLENNRTRVSVSFANDSFGLSYGQDEDIITTFFQQIEQKRAKGAKGAMHE